MNEFKMSKIERAIQIFDIYGSYFNLRINNQAKFKSVLGGVLSIITMAVFLFCILSFGQDFYKKKNPKVSLKEGFFDDDKIPKLSGNDYENKTIILMVDKSMDNRVFPSFFNTKDQSLLLLPKCDLEFLLNQGLANKDTLETAPFNYFCLDLNSFEIGSDSAFLNDNFNGLVIQFMECTIIPEEMLDNSGYKCDHAFLNDPEGIIYRASFDILYEKYGFNPDSENPFMKKWSSFSFLFSNGKMSVIEIPMITTNLEDDRGLISPDIRNSTVLNIKEYTITHYDIGGNIPRIVLKFSISDDHKTYIRSYQKLQDLMASIGGFMKLIFAGLNIFNFIIRSYLIDMHIIDTLFRREEEESDMNQILKGDISMDSIKSSKHMNITLIENKFNNYFSEDVKTVGTKDINLKISRTDEKSNKAKIRKSQSEKKTESCFGRSFTYFNAVFHNFFSKKFSRDSKDDARKEILRNKLVVADRIRDFNYIAEKMNELDVLKGMILNEHQSLCLKFLKKPSYVEVSDISKTFSTMANSNDQNIDIICNYFIKLLNEDPLSGYDEFLFRNIDERIRERILMKLAGKF